MNTLVWTLLLPACDPATPDVGDSGKPGRDSGVDTADTADTADTDASAQRCSEAPALPLERPEQIQGFTSAEDFTFNGAGQHVSIDENGNLVGITYEGTKSVLLPGAGYGAGTHMLADGQIVFADVTNNALVKVDPASFSSVVLTSGLNYPNGLDVGIDGAVYVAETGVGSLRRVDAVTGESEVIARGLSGANGVSFGPGFTSIYVGSFGGGVVWRLDQEAEGWSEPVVHGLVPGAAEPPPPPCSEDPLGSVCSPAGGYGVGECGVLDDGTTDCVLLNDTAACEGKAEGDPCATTAFGHAIDSVCATSVTTHELLCPAAPTEYVAPCVDARPGKACSVGDLAGSCSTNFQSAPICAVTTYLDSMTAACEGLAAGDVCVSEDYVYGWVGVCGDGSAWGAGALACVPGSYTGGEAGGLDGLNVDECGNVYATSYVVGKVWRWTAERAEPELVSDVRASWIPNMHWGNGIGGWAEDVLYVANRDQSSVFALEVGVYGHGEAFDPTP